MTKSSERYLQMLREAQTIMPDQLPEDFPYSEFQRNLTKYNENDDWYNGDALDETISIAGQQVEKYPVKINPIKGTCARHVSMLFGDIKDDDSMLVTPRVVKRATDTDEDSRKINDLENMFIQVWYENNGRDIQFNNGMMSQRYGGCLFYFKYDPNQGFQFPISVEAPTPKFFIGVPNSSNPYMLEEAWIIRPISKVEIDNQSIVRMDTILGLIRPGWDDDVHWIVEHYTKKVYEVFVDGKRVGRDVILPSQKRQVVQIGGENKLGVVPIVYIPHIRNSANFYGDNVFDGVRGLVREMNARVADFGDAVSMDSHDIVVTRNVNGSPTITSLLPGITRVDLGSGINVTGQESQPEATSLKKASMANSAMDVLVRDVLYKQYRRDAIHPAVCDGEDEGSQRSSQTLTTRMWALETHALQERIEWTAGLNVASKIILRILQVNAPELGFDESYNKYRIRQVWYPTLKRDRLDIITELSTRMGADLVSIEHAIEMLGDVENVEEEVEKIYANKKKLAELEPKPAFGASSSTTKKNTTSNPTKQTKQGE